MNKFISCLVVVGVFLAGSGRSLAGETKTAPDRDVFVEHSTNELALTAKASPPGSDSVVTFDFSGPGAGKYTLVCFIDGRVFKQEPLTLPGSFKLSVRGMASGTHKITLQLVDADGRVGSHTQQIQVADRHPK